MLQIYEIPFFVALDHKREAVVVAVRGTLSLKVPLEFFFPPLIHLIFGQLGLKMQTEI